MALAHVDVEIKCIDLFTSLVGDRNLRVGVKRHSEECVECLFRSDGQWLRLEKKIFPEAEAKEIADGSLYARRAFIVPIHAKDQLLKVKLLARCDRNPEMSDHSWAGFVEDGKSLSGRNLTGIGVPASPVVARNPLEDVMVWQRESFEGATVVAAVLRM